jgi:chromosome segregation ATPase
MADHPELDQCANCDALEKEVAALEAEARDARDTAKHWQEEWVRLESQLTVAVDDVNEYQVQVATLIAKNARLESRLLEAEKRVRAYHDCAAFGCPDNCSIGMLLAHASARSDKEESRER